MAVDTVIKRHNRFHGKLHKVLYLITLCAMFYYIVDWWKRIKKKTPTTIQIRNYTGMRSTYCNYAL